MVFRRRRLKRPISIAKSVYGYIRTKVTAGRHFRTDLSVQKSERVFLIIVRNDCKKLANSVNMYDDVVLALDLEIPALLRSTVRYAAIKISTVYQVNPFLQFRVP